MNQAEKKQSWRMRLALTGVALAATIGAVLVPMSIEAEPAAAATAIDFQDGYIISDGNFTDSGSMDVGSVQAFLNSQVSRCVGANGQPCLKDYSTSVTAIGADSLCSGMSGGTMSSAQIIVAAARACGISPKVLLVMLQKEQGLITATSPTERNYRAALGQSCPDTAPCDSAFSGFYRQVYYGARQLRAYLAWPNSYAYRLGWNAILYNPEVSCGRKNVYIQNDATRALYIYTPYTPNGAALANLYGTGDGCSSYGNRNFWRMYTDWFGSPTNSGSDQISAAYTAQGGSRGWLGAALTGVICGAANGGCYKWFQNGLIFYSPTTGAQALSRAYHATWGTEGFESGRLGYPVTNQICGGAPNGGCYQWFQGGLISSSNTSAPQAVTRAYHSAWGSEGFESGRLGYPVTSQICGGAPNGGCYQWFQGGLISSSDTTTPQAVTSAYHSTWGSEGFESGRLGYPLTSQICGGAPNGGCYQWFQGGLISSSNTTAPQAVTNAYHATWGTQGYESGRLGYPLTNQICGGAPNGGCYQWFQGGLISSSNNTAPQAVTNAYHAAWGTQGYESGWLGYPLTNQICGGAPNGGCYQWFQGGLISSSNNTAPQAVSNAIHAAWGTVGYEGGRLGYPTGPVTTVSGGGTSQTFQGGTITIAPSGAATIN